MENSRLLSEESRRSTSGERAEAATASKQEETIPPHLSHNAETNKKRTDPFQFGHRFLEKDDNVFEFNAWDHVEPDDAFYAFAEEQYEKQRQSPVSESDKRKFPRRPGPVYRDVNDDLPRSKA